MSHTCPECDELCRCCGDIDDCMINTERTARSCKHWKKCDPDYSQEDDEDGNDP